jgi:hypothetical protein
METERKRRERLAVEIEAAESRSDWDGFLRTLRDAAAEYDSDEVEHVLTLLESAEAQGEARVAALCLALAYLSSVHRAEFYDRAISSLSVRARDDSAQVRSAVAEALRHLGGGKADELLNEVEETAWKRFLSTTSAWAKELPAGYRADDSRESIYSDRGE